MVVADESRGPGSADWAELLGRQRRSAIDAICVVPIDAR